MSEARNRWLDEGAQVLAEEGPAGVRIDRIAARLGLSKGSFHHHFAGADGYKRDLLGHIEELSTRALDDAIAGATVAGDVQATLAKLSELIGSGGGPHHPQLDVALRGWASSDAEVRATQGRIDQARLAALQGVWRPYVDTDEQARRAALLPYLLAVGASVVTPPVGPAELKVTFQSLLPLVPGQGSCNG